MRDQAHNDFSLGLVVDVHEWDAAGAGLKHAAAGFVEGFEGMDGDGFDGVDADGPLDVAEAIKLELVDLV